MPRNAHRSIPAPAQQRQACASRHRGHSRTTTFYHCVFIEQDLKNARQMLQHGTAPDTTANLWSELTVLHRSADAGNKNWVALLLLAGAQNTTHPTPYSASNAVLAAARNGHTGILALLQAAGVNLHATLEHHGSTILHHLAHHRLLHAAATTTWLANHGADVNARDREGSTALHIAANENLVATVQALLQAGADPERRNGHGQTAFELSQKDSYCKQLLYPRRRHDETPAIAD